MTGPPVKKVEDKAVRRGDDVERQFGWFEPRKRRPSVYEEVTIDTQPSPHRHLTRGWPIFFEDGRGIWDDESTALQSSDWFAFRDPGEQWERPYYQRGTAAERTIDAAVQTATAEGLFADFSPEWVEFLRGFLQVPAFVEHGLWFALATSARQCLSDSTTACMALQAAMKQRSAQAIVIYAMDLEPHHGDFSIDTARSRWLTDPAFQPGRRAIERMAAISDWGELIIAANVCAEPFIGTLLRRELGIRAASANGDTVTPVLARVAMGEWEWARAWTAEFLRFVCADERHGDANRERIAGWLSDWLPRSLDAMVAMLPVIDELPVGIDAAEAAERSRVYAKEFFDEAGIADLVEVPR